ncbi:hypothetical protein ACFQPA_21245 [Halomarina halobia]|uniref:Uncharacterized protein n=1 Tax=Halomarina halobia TaxID=3033386 RepID=A0ABD6AGS7_9EURY|nr:hypothetical protein [Halomarina sp. PSR21]
MTRVVHRPRRLSGGIAVLAALLAVALVADEAEQLAAVGASFAGVAVLALGAALRRRGSRLAGLPVALAGLAASLAAVAVAVGVALTDGVTARGELVGLLGVPLLALGLVPISRRAARRLISAGFALVVVGTVFSATVGGASTLSLLGSLVAAVVAWDAGERAINLGDQLGTDARTWPVELAHSGATAAFGCVSVALALALSEANVTGVPLAGLALLLGAAVTLMVVLYA